MHRYAKAFNGISGKEWIIDSSNTYRISLAQKRPSLSPSMVRVDLH